MWTSRIWNHCAYVHRMATGSGISIHVNLSASWERDRPTCPALQFGPAFCTVLYHPADRPRENPDYIFTVLTQKSCKLHVLVTVMPPLYPAGKECSDTGWSFQLKVLRSTKVPLARTTVWLTI